MRTLVIFLVLANLALAGYLWLDSASGGEAVRLKQQVQPDKIKLLSPQEVLTLGPAKAAALADVCLEWGPFSAMSYWIFLPPFANKAAADKRAAELKSAGVKDVLVIDGGPQRFALSLGAFKAEDAANAQLVELAKQGVAGAKVGPRQQVVLQSLIVIRDPQQPVIAKLRDLAPAYPAADTKIGGCEKPA
jgi:hypothetical protein